MGHVLFPAPGQQNRGVLHRDGDGDGLPDDVHLGATTKAAAHQPGLNRDGPDRQSGQRRAFGQNLGRQLVAGPDSQVPVLQLGGGGHRLHRGMGKVQGRVGRFKDIAGQRSVNIAVVAIAAVLTVRVEAVVQGLRDGGAVGGIAGGDPVEGNDLGGLQCSPGRRGDHSHPAEDRHDFLDLRHRQGGGGVIPVHRRAKVRVAVGGGKAQVGGEFGGAGGFGQHVDARRRLAQQPPICAQFRLWGCGQRLFCGVRGKVSIKQPCAARGNHCAAFGFQRIGGDIQSRSGGLHQCGPGGSARKAHLVKGVNDRG